MAAARVGLFQAGDDGGGLSSPDRSADRERAFGHTGAGCAVVPMDAARIRPDVMKGVGGFAPTRFAQKEVSEHETSDI